MIVTGDDFEDIPALKSYLHQQFEMQDLGYLQYYRGIEIAYSLDGYIFFFTNEVYQ